MASAVVDEVASAVDGLDTLELQRLMELVVRRYAALILGQGSDLTLPFPPGSTITATEALVAAGQILRFAEISSFELASILNI